jgi:hypothetical protein
MHDQPIIGHVGRKLRAIRKKHADAFFSHYSELAKYEVAPGGIWKDVSRLWTYPGDCFARAGRFMLSNHPKLNAAKNPALCLVHGLYQPSGEGPLLYHAWVEIGSDVIFDGVLQAFYAATGYAEVCRSQPEARYTSEQFLNMVVNHYGPWHVERESDGELRGVRVV